MTSADPYERFGLTIHGWAFPAHSSRRVAARLLTRAPVQGEGAGPDDVIVDVMEGEVVLTSAALSRITVDPPLGKAARKLHFPDRALFETEDRAGIGALTGATYGEKLHRFEALHPRLIGVVATLLVVGFVIWRWGLDILVAGAIALTPPSVIGQMDRGSLQSIDFAMGAEPSQLSQAEKDRVLGVFSSLLAELPAQDVNDHGFELLFRSMPSIGPNAFALPGGTVVMTDQFVRRFPQDDVLAGVLGHEIGHVIEQHGLRQTYRALGMYVLVGFLAGETGPFIEEILLEGNLLLSLRFSRTHEAAADAFGVTLTNQAGFDPAGLRSFFDDMASEGGQPPRWLSTHPSSDERVQQIEGYIEALEK